MTSESVSKTPTRLTREELYKQVWETPMQRLAAQYGISGNGLAKICDRLKVPYPHRGYWAKKAANKPVRQLALPAPDGNTPSEAKITPTPQSVGPSAPQMPPELQAKFDEAKGRAASVRVPANLRNPHPVVARWIADHARQIAEAKRFGGGFSPPKFTELDHRRHLILHTLFKELEKRDIKIKDEQYRGAWLEIGKERVDFTLSERIRQIRRPLTDKERQDSWRRDQKWTQERVPSGLLVFKITTSLSAGIPTQWTDDAESLLEEKLSEILAVLELAGPILLERRRLAEEAQRRQHEAERLRYEREQKRKQESNRWRRFLELADQWQSASVARGFLRVLEELPAASGDFGGRSHNEWLQWARDQLEGFDPAKHGGEDIWASLGSVNSWTYRD